jgi:hypothetical protein
MVMDIKNRMTPPAIPRVPFEIPIPDKMASPKKANERRMRAAMISSLIKIYFCLRGVNFFKIAM